MPTKRTVTAVAASALTLFFLSPAFAQDERRQGDPDPSLPQMQKDQIEDTARPDVDSRASQGRDLPITEQERQQMEGGVGSRAIGPPQQDRE